MPTRPFPRYRIVARNEGSPYLRRVAIAALWLGSLLLVWQLSARLAAPRLADAGQRLGGLEATLRQSQAELRRLAQREATLSRSDSISRDANRDLQRTLADRDEEIAGLRADVAFYERLVGPTDQRQGLNVFSSEFAAEAGPSWKYQIVLTQNLNRGAVSQGGMRFAIEGTRDGKLATLGWSDLQQKPDAPEQAYSFRYFQELRGSVLLPPGFVPHRVRVSLRGGDASIERVFDWKLAST